jgi:spore germination protein YaaH
VILPSRRRKAGPPSQAGGSRIDPFTGRRIAQPMARSWPRGIAAALVAAVVVTACTPSVSPSPVPAATEVASPGGEGTTAPASGPPPASGHELYGFVPYWEMDATIAAHLAATPLTTIGLFSVTHTAKGALRDSKGYQAITGDTGRQVIRQAHDRGVRVELVFTSFGESRNRKLLESATLQAAVTASLVALVDELGLDGVNVDVEALDPGLVPAYGTFVAGVRQAVVAADPGDQVSVATGAGATGAAMAAAAALAGADRIFLMGYDYRTGRSNPGASSPLDRGDGGSPSLRSSLDLYQALGVPPERTLLGLPLYGIVWPVAGPVIGAPSTGRGAAWILRRNLDLLQDPAAVPERDDVEQVEVYFVGSDGTLGAPSADPAAGPGGTTADRTWKAVYVDSPATLEPKMALVDERGLAGAGFWAIGYERGLPGYTRLMERFREGAAAP